MEASAVDFWGNTLTQQSAAYQGMDALPVGQFFLSLVLVVGLMLGLAWLAKRMGWLDRRIAASEEKKDQILFHSQFNAAQTLMLLENQEGIQCLILRDNKVEMSVMLPQLQSRALPKTAAGPGKPMTFQDLLKKGMHARGPRP